MKQMTLGRVLLITITCLTLLLTQAAHAAHATNFLDTLQAEVNTRLENVTEETTRAERRALSSAARTLNRNSRSLAGDLSLLNSASTTLNRAFPEDATLLTLQNDAVTDYAEVAEAQYDAVIARAGTNAIPRSISNQLAQAAFALERAENTSNSIPVRVRAVAFALNKIRVANSLANRFFRAPTGLEGHDITLRGRGGLLGITLNGDGTYTVPGDEEETGTWTYERTGPSTATITATPNGGGGAEHTVNLRFTSSTRGTFTGTTANDESIRGSFRLTPQAAD